MSTTIPSPRSELATVGEVFALFGGTTAAAQVLGVLPSAASNWKKKGMFPEHTYRRIQGKVMERGYTVNEGLFGHPFATSSKAVETAA